MQNSKVSCRDFFFRKTRTADPDVWIAKSMPCISKHIFFFCTMPISICTMKRFKTKVLIYGFIRYFLLYCILFFALHIHCLYMQNDSIFFYDNWNNTERRKLTHLPFECTTKKIVIKEALLRHVQSFTRFCLVYHQLFDGKAFFATINKCSILSRLHFTVH